MKNIIKKINGQKWCLFQALQYCILFWDIVEIRPSTRTRRESKQSKIQNSAKRRKKREKYKNGYLVFIIGKGQGYEYEVEKEVVRDKVIIKKCEPHPHLWDTNATAHFLDLVPSRFLYANF